MIFNSINYRFSDNLKNEEDEYMLYLLWLVHNMVKSEFWVEIKSDPVLQMAQKQLLMN